MWHSYWSFSASKSGVAAVYPVTSISFLSACLCAEPEGSLYSYSNKCIRSASKDHEHGPDHLTKFDSILHLMQRRPHCVGQSPWKVKSLYIVSIHQACCEAYKKYTRRNHRKCIMSSWPVSSINGRRCCRCWTHITEIHFWVLAFELLHHFLLLQLI